MSVPRSTFYLAVEGAVGQVLGPVNKHRSRAAASLAVAVLSGQSLRPADLSRGLPNPQTLKARQAYRRTSRAKERPVWDCANLSPRLIQAVLRLVGSGTVDLVLDSTRCRRWEVLTLGIRVGGRVLPVAWQVLPYPWPKGLMPRKVAALFDQTLAHWPADRPVNVLADRGFPSYAFLALLQRWRGQLPLSYTVRICASDYVHAANGESFRVGDLEEGVAKGEWQIYPYAYGKRGQGAVESQCVVGRGEDIYPFHQRGPADQARRAKRAARRAQHLRSKGKPGSVATYDAWALTTTETEAQIARDSYRRRFSTEATYRDLKSWQLERALADQTSLEACEHILGQAALAYLVQFYLGMAVEAEKDEAARIRQAQWCTTTRLSYFWRGRQVLLDRVFDWQPIVERNLYLIADQLRHQRAVPLPKAA